MLIYELICKLSKWKFEYHILSKNYRAKKKETQKKMYTIDWKVYNWKYKFKNKIMKIVS